MRQAVGGKVDLMVLIGGVEEQATIQWERSIWLRKGGDRNTFYEYMVMKGGDKRGSGDHVRQGYTFSD
jgi:hypothetical protein